MADNPYVNKVVLGNQTIMDLTQDSVEPSNLLEGETAHSRSGEPITGTAKQGHSILNKLGTLLTQRSKLKFGGMLKTTDDGTNDITIVSDEAEEIEWSVWSAMTEAQQNAYSAGKKLDIVNAPWASGHIPVELIKTLWTNPNPTSAFAAQDITLASDDYDYLLLSYIYHTDYTIWGLSDIVTKGRGFLLHFSYAGRDWSRTITRTSNTVLHVDAGQEMDVGNNNACIPVAIYGIKSSVTVDVSGIVANVSTDASKCMLSDGVTNVEDTLSTKINKSGDTMSGNLTIGTTSRGELSLAGNNPSYNGRFYNSSIDALTSNRSYSIPNNDGTLALLSDIFIKCPRKTTIDLNDLPELNKVNFVEVSPDCPNIPSVAWFHVMTIQGGDGLYATQIAIGLTDSGIYYRRKAANVWTTWVQIVN